MGPSGLGVAWLQEGCIQELTEHHFSRVLGIGVFPRFLRDIGGSMVEMSLNVLVLCIKPLDLHEVAQR